MKLITKPEGFDFRDKRSDKSRSGSDWEPRDVLYAVNERLKDKEVDAIIIIYRERSPEGNVCTKHVFAGPQDSGAQLIITGLGRFMGWEKA